jgi:hypothetical protein
MDEFQGIIPNCREQNFYFPLSHCRFNSAFPSARQNLQSNPDLLFDGQVPNQSAGDAAVAGILLRIPLVPFGIFPADRPAKSIRAHFAVRKGSNAGR